MYKLQIFVVANIRKTIFVNFWQDMHLVAQVPRVAAVEVGDAVDAGEDETREPLQGHVDQVRLGLADPFG
jgi:hypothetical protein